MLQGDTLRLELDLQPNNLTLTGYLNGKRLGVLVQGNALKDRKYHWCVGLEGGRGSAEHPPALRLTKRLP